jgi:DNA-binding GntR family transcriptional regulator
MIDTAMDKVYHNDSTISIYYEHCALQWRRLKVDLKRLKISPSEPFGQQLHEVLEEAIIDGRIPPGERLHAEEMAAHFGVSRIPVREALRTLQASGWVEARPRRGVFVPVRTRRELDQLFELRLILEVEAARMAADRRTPEDLKALDQTVAQGLAAIRRGDISHLSLLNQQFHTAIAEATHNEILARVCHALGSRVRWYYAAVLPERGQPSLGEHQEFVEAIRDRDSTLAANIARHHIETTRTSALNALVQDSLVDAAV